LEGLGDLSKVGGIVYVDVKSEMVVMEMAVCSCRWLLKWRRTTINEVATVRSYMGGKQTGCEVDARE
jgi:hypothetical protein